MSLPGPATRRPTRGPATLARAPTARPPMTARSSAAAKTAARGAQRVVVRRAHRVEDGAPGRGGQRVPRQGARLVDGTRRGEAFEHVGPAAEGAEREPTADHLAEAPEVGRHAERRTGRPGAHPEPGDHLVEDEQCADRVAGPAQLGQEPGLGRHQVHVGRHRLDDDAGDGVVELGHGVVRHDHRVGHGAAGHARRGRAGRASPPRCRRRPAARRRGRGSSRRTSRRGRDR